MANGGREKKGRLISDCEICACERKLSFFSVLTRDVLEGKGEISQLLHTVVHGNDFKVPFPSSLVPQFQSESKCEAILMKMT